MVPRTSFCDLDDDFDIPSPAEGEPEELTLEVGAATKFFATAKKRMSNAIRARGFLKNPNPRAGGGGVARLQAAGVARVRGTRVTARPIALASAAAKETKRHSCV